MQSNDFRPRSILVQPSMRSHDICMTHAVDELLPHSSAQVFVPPRQAEPWSALALRASRGERAL